MGNNLYEFIIKAKDEASKTFKTVQKNFGSMADDYNKRNAQMIDQSKKFALGLGVVGVAAAGLAGKMALDAAENIRTQKTFASLGDSIGLTTKSMNAMRKSTNGLVSDNDLMLSGNKLMAMGLATSEDEMTKVMNTATRLGQAMGTGPTQSMEDFALMLANQSIPRLDTFGISSGRVRERINELMAANAGMTRETAFMTATMEEAEKSLVKLGDFVPTASERIGQMQVKTANLAQRFGEMLLPVLEAAIPVLESLVNGLEMMINLDWGKWLQENQVLLGAVAGVITAMLVPAILSAAAAGVAFVISWAPVLALAGAIGAAIIALKIGWENDFMGMRSATIGLWTAVMDAFGWIERNILPSMQQVFGELNTSFTQFEQVVTMFTEHIGMNWDNIYSKTDEVFGLLETLFGNYWKGMGGIVTFYTSLMTGDVSGAFDSMQTMIDSSMGNIKAVIETTWGFIADYMNSVVPGLGDTVNIGFQFIYDTISSILGSVYEFFVNTFESIIGFFENVWVRLVEGAQGGAQGVLTAIGQMLVDVIKAFTDLPAQAVGWGRDMVMGFADGIANAAGAAAQAAANMAQSAMSSVTGMLGINSPSRVFMQYGEWTGEGLANGMRASLDMVRGAGLETAMAAASPMEEVGRGARTAVSGSSSPTNNQNNNVVINITGGAESSPAEIARAVKAELTRELRLTQLGSIRA